MSIYSRGGDRGETSLVDGTRTGKDSARVEAYGAIDEANSAVGFARASNRDVTLDAVLEFIQQRLFNCSSLLATPPKAVTDHTPGVTPEDIGFLERAIDHFESRSGPLTHFIIEGGCETAARLQMARAVTRRAERAVVALGRQEETPHTVVAFLNRCSDTLFAAARYANSLEDVAEQTWDAHAAPPPLT